MFKDTTLYNTIYSIYYTISVKAFLPEMYCKTLGIAGDVEKVSCTIIAWHLWYECTHTVFIYVHTYTPPILSGLGIP